MQTLVMSEVGLIPLDGLLGAPLQSETDPETARAQRACDLACVVALVKCQSVERLLIGSVEVVQEL